MKNRLLPLFVVLGSFSAYSQVGVGTKTPNASLFWFRLNSNNRAIIIF